MTDNLVATSDLAGKAMSVVDRAGIATSEISEEVPSVFEVIGESMDHRQGSTPLDDPTSDPYFALVGLANYSFRLSCGATGRPAMTQLPHQDPLLLSVVPIFVNLALIEFPSAPAPVIIASAIRAAIRPYSIAVAPDSS